MPRICDEEHLSLSDWIAAGDEFLARAGTLPLEQVQMLAVVAEPGRRAGVFQRELERRATMEAP